MQLKFNKNNVIILLILLVISAGLIFIWLNFSNSLLLKPITNSPTTKPILTLTDFIKESENNKPPPERIFNFLFVGDLMLDRNVKAKIDKYGVDYLFENLDKKFFKGYDIISANLEGALTNNGQHYLPEASIDFAIDPKIVAQIKKNYSFNFFSLANNHILDQGHFGFEETTENLTKLDIDFTGCPDAVVDDCSTSIINIENQKIGMAAFSMVYRSFDLEAAKEKINVLKNQTDLVITQVHWGVEYSHNFNLTQQNIAHVLIDAGSDIIIGHHPHVVQGIEIYKDKPIFYSLGNFVFDQYFSPDTQEELGVGIAYLNNKYIIDLFPLQSTDSQLSQMEDANKENFFNKLADWSNLEENYKNQLLTGTITLP